MFGNVSTEPCFPLRMKRFYTLRSIQLAASRMWCFLWETSELCLLCMCRALLRANLHISVFCACATRPKVASVSSGTKSFGYFGEKLERPSFFFSFFPQMTKSWTLRGYLYFQNALLIFKIFKNEYSRAVMVGMDAFGIIWLAVWCLCVCLCMRACVRACVCVRVCEM